MPMEIMGDTNPSIAHFLSAELGVYAKVKVLHIVRYFLVLLSFGYHPVPLIEFTLIKNECVNMPT